MAIGRSFPEALQKALRSLEKKGASFSWGNGDLAELLKVIGIPTEFRLQQVQQALFLGASVDEVFSITKIDPWFLEQIRLINQKAIEISQPGELTKELLKSSKQMGFSDFQIAELRNEKAFVDWVKSNYEYEIIESIRESFRKHVMDSVENVDGKAIYKRSGEILDFITFNSRDSYISTRFLTGGREVLSQAFRSGSLTPSSVMAEELEMAVGQ